MFVPQIIMLWLSQKHIESPVHYEPGIFVLRKDGRIYWYRGDHMNPCELTASITAIANTIACSLTVDEINLLGVTLTQLGDTLLTIATRKSICCKTD